MADQTTTQSAPDRNLALELVRVTEAAAIAAGHWVGAGDKNSADGAAVDAISRISGVIESLNGYQETIASAVEEQSVTTAEMSRNVAEAATGTSQIAASVGGVAGAARRTQDDAGRSLRAAEDLAAMSATLRQAVEMFTV